MRRPEGKTEGPLLTVRAYRFLWMGQGLPSLQYLHLSSGTGMIDFTMCPYLRLGMLSSEMLRART